MWWLTHISILICFISYWMAQLGSEADIVQAFSELAAAGYTTVRTLGFNDGKYWERNLIHQITVLLTSSLFSHGLCVSDKYMSTILVKQSHSIHLY